jgi:hypothetical protein
MRGSIVKRGRTWSYVLYLGRAADGRKRQKWVGGFRTRKDAEAALAKALDQVHTGTYADAGKVTVGEYLEEWLDGIRPSLREKEDVPLAVEVAAGGGPVVHAAMGS